MMKRSSLRLLPALCVCVVVALAFVAVSASASSGVTKVSLAGTGAPQTGAFSPSGSGDVTQAEFPEQEDEATPAPFAGSIVDRSLSRGVGSGVSVTSGKKAKSSPQFNTGWEGLNLYQQRYARGGNQFTVEPPDQGLCVGNGYVVEAVNDVINVFNTSGQSVLPDNTATNIVSGFPRNVNHAVDLNSFYGYAPAINRTTGVRAQSVTDPSCLYDAATQRFFVVVLDPRVTPERLAHAREPPRHRGQPDVEPDGQWNIYRTDVTNDGTDTGGTEQTPARTSATIRTSARTRTASTSPPTPTRGSATASPARRSTRSRRRSSPQVPRT